MRILYGFPVRRPISAFFGLQLMTVTPSSDDENSASAEPSSAVSVLSIVTLVATLAAGWIAAGSVGLLGHPLRHAMTWLALAVAIVANWPRREEASPLDYLALAGAVVLGLIMTASSLPAVNVLAVAVVAGVLVRRQTGVDGRAVRLAALAVAVLGIFRLSCASIPTVWLAADALGGTFGRLGGWLAGEPLWVGATFGGVDFLVLMTALYAGWLVCTAPPSLPRAVYAAAAIVLGHLAYLVVLALSTELRGALPDLFVPELTEIDQVGSWSWGNALRSLLPWNLPLLAGIIHATIAVAMFRWAAWLPAAEPARNHAARHQRREARGEGRGARSEERGARSEGRGTRSERPRWLSALRPSLLAFRRFGPVVLAVVIPVLTVLAPSKSALKDKTIVAYEKGYLSWAKPEHLAAVPGNGPVKPNAGAYGMLPQFVKSLGGSFLKSPDLSEPDLAEPEKKVLLLLHPDEPWPEGTLERIREFVREGGSLLVVAGPRMTYQRTFNEVLRETKVAMRVRYDTAVPAVISTVSPVGGPGCWEQSLDPLAHPTTVGIDDRRNRFALVGASSIDIHWPARPILAGGFGWSDPGSDAAHTGFKKFQYDAGEKLGDLVLAAEERIGKGRIVVLGAASALENDGIANSYPFTGRLLSYLAGTSFFGYPQDGWRQLLAVLAVAALVGLLAWELTAEGEARDEGSGVRGQGSGVRGQGSGVRGQGSGVRGQGSGVRTGPWSLISCPSSAAAALGISLVCCTASSHWTARILPDGRTHSPNNLAYIDASHLEAYSGDTWSRYGIGGLVRTLARSGYLPLLLPELTSERLERAGLLISIAPARPFSERERAAVREFVKNGGTLICMAGAEDAGGSRELLADFDFRIPPSPVPPTENVREPEPVGQLHSRYLELEDYEPKMHLYAAWPVECTAADAEMLKTGLEGQQIIVRRPVGKGTAVVIGDTYFATNQNLESAENVLSENVTFWHWFIGRVTDQKEWIPTKPDRERAPFDELPPEEPTNADPAPSDPSNYEQTP